MSLGIVARAGLGQMASGKESGYELRIALGDPFCVQLIRSAEDEVRRGGWLRAFRRLAARSGLDDGQHVVRGAHDAQRAHEAEARAFPLFGRQGGERGRRERLALVDFVLRKNPDNVRARAVRGQALLAQRRFREAAATFGELVLLVLGTGSDTKATSQEKEK